MPALTFPAAVTCILYTLLGSLKDIQALPLTEITTPEDHLRRSCVVFPEREQVLDPRPPDAAAGKEPGRRGGYERPPSAWRDIRAI